MLSCKDADFLDGLPLSYGHAIKDYSQIPLARRPTFFKSSDNCGFTPVTFQYENFYFVSHLADTSENCPSFKFLVYFGRKTDVKVEA